MKKEKEAREAYLRSNPDRTVRVITYKHNKKKTQTEKKKPKKNANGGNKRKVRIITPSTNGFIELRCYNGIDTYSISGEKYTLNIGFC